MLSALFAEDHIPACVLHEAAGNMAMAGATEVRAFADAHAAIHDHSVNPIARRRCAEIEAEQALVYGNRKLITRFEQKIPTTLASRVGRGVALPHSPVYPRRMRRETAFR